MTVTGSCSLRVQPAPFDFFISISTNSWPHLHLCPWRHRIHNKRIRYAWFYVSCCRQARFCHHLSWRILIENTVACLDRICRLKIILCRTIGIYKLKPVWNSQTTTAFTTCQRIIGLLFCYITPCNSVFFHKLINSWVAPCILISISKMVSALIQRLQYTPQSEYSQYI